MSEGTTREAKRYSFETVILGLILGFYVGVVFTALLLHWVIVQQGGCLK